MNSYDRTKIGKLIAWGGEHFVYDYDKDKIIKFSIIEFILGRKKAEEKANQDYSNAKKFFGKYLLETEVVNSPSGRYIALIQPKIVGHYLSKKDLEIGFVWQQFKEIMDGYFKMIKAGNVEVDLIGRPGAFNRCMANIFVTNDNKLLIIEATSIDIKYFFFLKPFFSLLRICVLWRQNSTIKDFMLISIYETN